MRAAGAPEIAARDLAISRNDIAALSLLNQWLEQPPGKNSND
jgi:hypothetical protein